MDITPSNLKWLRQSGFLLLLAFGAISGNLFGIPMFSGVYFWFGSIATLIVVSLYGSWWGALVAFVSTWLVLSLGDQGIVGLIYVGEAFIVGQILPRRKQNLLIADWLFWCIVGMPLIWLINRVLFNMDFASTMFLTLKSGVDGVFNALVANLIVTYLPVRKWVSQEDQDWEAKYLTMENMLFNLLVIFILLPTFAFTISDIRNEQLKLQDEIVSKLQEAGTIVERQLTKIDSINTQEQQVLSKIIMLVDEKDSLDIAVTDSTGRLLATSKPGGLPIKALGKGHVTKVKGNVSLWLPNKRSQIFHGQEWSEALYYHRINFSGRHLWQVELTSPASVCFLKFQRSANTDLAGVLLLTFLAIYLAKIISRTLIGPLGYLSKVTTDLPYRREGQAIDWPESKIYEINLLINNFKVMARTLNNDFQEVQAATVIAEREKSKSEAVIACIGDGLGVVNSQMEIVFQNQSIKEMLGEYQLQKCYVVYAGRTKPCRNCPVALAMADGKVHRGEMVTSREKGRRPIEITASPMRDANGGIVGGLEIVRDISDRRQTELALQKQRSKLEIQLNYSQALAHIAEIVISSEDTGSIWDSMCRTVVQTLGLDRALIFRNDQENDKVSLIAEWTNPETGKALINIHSFESNYPINFFTEKTDQGWVESHENALSPLLDIETGRKLHEEWGIRSLLWYPFAYYQAGHYVMVINQLSYRREWRTEEITFLGDATKQVEIALQKNKYLDELRKSSDLLLMQSAAMNATMDGMALLDTEGNTVYVNASLARLYGYKNEELLTKTWRELIASEEATRFTQEILPEFRKYGRWHGETTGQKRDGSLFVMELSMDSIAGVGIVWVLRDITEQKQMFHQLVYQAHHDTLTALPNRLLFQERLELELKHAKRKTQHLAVLFLDLDKFKQVNDTMGHAIGDELLKEVTLRLISCVRESDTIARIGGDEFTLLLPDITSKHDAANVAKKIMFALQKPWNIDGQEFQVTTSIGIAIFPEDGKDIDTLLKNADSAMYWAKEVGRNNYVIYDSSIPVREGTGE